jgi:hypothetical protein
VAFGGPLVKGGMEITITMRDDRGYDVSIGFKGGVGAAADALEGDKPTKGVGRAKAELSAMLEAGASFVHSFPANTQPSALEAAKRFTEIVLSDAALVASIANPVAAALGAPVVSTGLAPTAEERAALQPTLSSTALSLADSGAFAMELGFVEHHEQVKNFLLGAELGVEWTYRFERDEEGNPCLVASERYTAGGSGSVGIAVARQGKDANETETNLSMLGVDVQAGAKVGATIETTYRLPAGFDFRQDLRPQLGDILKGVKDGPVGTAFTLEIETQTQASSSLNPVSRMGRAGSTTTTTYSGQVDGADLHDIFYRLGHATKTTTVSRDVAVVDIDLSAMGKSLGAGVVLKVARREIESVTTE